MTDKQFHLTFLCKSHFPFGLNILFLIVLSLIQMLQKYQNTRGRFLWYIIKPNVILFHTTKENFLILEDIIICFSHKQRDYFRAHQLEYWILLIQQNPFSCTQFSSNKNIWYFFNVKQMCNCLFKNKQTKKKTVV